MAISDLRFVKRCAEWEARDKIHFVPRGTRGLYTLLNEIQHLREVYYTGNEVRVVTILGISPVDSPRRAVRVSIVADLKK